MENSEIKIQLNLILKSFHSTWFPSPDSLISTSSKDGVLEALKQQQTDKIHEIMVFKTLDIRPKKLDESYNCLSLLS